MNCKTFLTHLLNQENPGRVTGDYRHHVAECPTCRAWQRRLVQVERHVPLIPVPASPAKAIFVEHMRSATPPPRRRLPPGFKRDRIVWIAAGLAASVLLAVGGIYLSQLGQPARTPVAVAAPDPFLKGFVELDLRLAAARTQRERVDCLAEMADALSREGQAIASVASGDLLRALSRSYQQVLDGSDGGLVAQAKQLGKEERHEVLPRLALSLTKAGREADELAGRMAGDSGEPLREFARAARQGSQKLRAMI